MVRDMLACNHSRRSLWGGSLKVIILYEKDKNQSVKIHVEQIQEIFRMYEVRLKKDDFS